MNRVQVAANNVAGPGPSCTKTGRTGNQYNYGNRISH